MGRHDQKVDRRNMICSSCSHGNCNSCVDVTRILAGYKNMICQCTRAGHSGEPSDQQILDPETGTVHAPSLRVTEDGEIIRPVEKCSACGSTEEHHLNYVKQWGLCVT